PGTACLQGQVQPELGAALSRVSGWLAPAAHHGRCLGAGGGWLSADLSQVRSIRSTRGDGGRSVTTSYRRSIGVSSMSIREGLGSCAFRVLLAQFEVEAVEEVVKGRRQE